ncbi:MAG: hypothetical protein V8R16_02655 [Bacilli bacterium]
MNSEMIANEFIKKAGLYCFFEENAILKFNGQKIAKPLDNDFKEY